MTDTLLYLFDKLKYKKTDVVFNKIQNIQKDRFIKLKINNIIVGDLIIDTYIRFEIFNHRF